MSLLLDTCVLLWMVADPNRISTSAKRKINQKQDQLCVSAISAFEVAIKHKKNKLALPMDPEQWFQHTIDFFNIEEIPVSGKIAAISTNVEVQHSDPCDRIIIATAIVNNIPIVSPDSLIQECKQIEFVW